jgi:hypothetical protein
MQATQRSPAWGLYAVALIGGYFAIYPLLWKREVAEMYALTDHGCFRKTMEMPALRSVWLADSALRTPVTALYSPINSVLYANARWK